MSDLQRIPAGPDRCPFTGRRFWGNIEHPELGLVATYGGPYDTYTIPMRTDDDPDYCVRRFDQDEGHWTDDVECIGLKVVGDQLYTSDEDPEELRSTIRALQAEVDRLTAENGALRSKVRAFRNRLVQEVEQSKEGSYELRRLEAEHQVNEFEDAFDAAMSRERS